MNSEVDIEERETVAGKSVSYQRDVVFDGHNSAAYTRAMSTNLLQKDAEQLVPAVLARAAYEKRRLESEAGTAN